MSDLIRHFVYRLMHFAFFRSLARFPIAVGNLFRKALIRYTQEAKATAETNLWKNGLKGELTVRSGPFAGMVYPSFQSFSSARIPKLTGTYESEIHADLERLLSKDYELIIDIGAAEGYYAVGLALRKPSVPVRGFDLNPAAIEACRAMASANKARNLSVETIFDTQEFRSFQDRNVLVICDIDGGEAPLFADIQPTKLNRTTLIIETHDYLDNTITPKLVETFRPTHHVKIIPYKPNKLDELPNYLSDHSREEKVIAVRERIVDNKWLVIEPR
ncbi:MAG: hypothetical protein AAFZ52_14075 [Bacteroidota bacterium]